MSGLNPNILSSSGVPNDLAIFPRCAVGASSFSQLSLSEAASESVAEARRVKRQRKLDQVEIPAEYLSITDELLGKGGFGECTWPTTTATMQRRRCGMDSLSFTSHHLMAMLNGDTSCLTTPPHKWTQKLEDNRILMMAPKYSTL